MQILDKPVTAESATATTREKMSCLVSPMSDRRCAPLVGFLSEEKSQKTQHTRAARQKKIECNAVKTESLRDVVVDLSEKNSSWIERTRVHRTLRAPGVILLCGCLGEERATDGGFASAASTARAASALRARRGRRAPGESQEVHRRHLRPPASRLAILSAPVDPARCRRASGNYCVCADCADSCCEIVSTTCRLSVIVSRFDGVWWVIIVSEREEVALDHRMRYCVYYLNM